ncbi:MAG: hypothetical protein R2784_15285 [Saprospiraceae bacterium]
MKKYFAFDAGSQKVKGKMSKSNLACLLIESECEMGKSTVWFPISKDPEDGQMHLYPVEDIENLNQKRAEMDLGPIEEYLLILI